MQFSTKEIFDEFKESLKLSDDFDLECCSREEYFCDDCENVHYCKSDLLEHNEICEIIDNCVDDFEYQIRSRGKKYYDDGNIVSIVRSGNRFISKVDGSDRYNVDIFFDEDDYFYIDYKCSCPYDFPCKHEYAVLLAIKNNEYKEIDLKPYISKKDLRISELVELIPSDDLKEYILSDEGRKSVYFDNEKFKKYFSKYLPKQSYEYYYNNLYNSLILDDNKKIDYISIGRRLINDCEYLEAFYVMKSLIEAANDANVLDKWEELIDSIPSIEMLLRIIYRKSEDSVKSNIDEWIIKLKDNNYYDSLYLEDLVLTLK